MAAFPDFTNMKLKEAPAGSGAEWQRLFESAAGADFAALTGKTMEHIPIKPIYNHDEYDHMNHLDFASGIPPCLRGPYSTMYVPSLDSKAVCRLFHGGGIQCLLPPQPGCRSEGLVHRL